MSMRIRWFKDTYIYRFDDPNHITYASYVDENIRYIWTVMTEDSELWKLYESIERRYKK